MNTFPEMFHTGVTQLSISSPVGSTKSTVWTLEYPIPYSVVVAPESDGQDYLGS